jgi:2-oxo-3-hexenedioate decarboxylase
MAQKCSMRADIAALAGEAVAGLRSRTTRVAPTERGPFDLADGRAVLAATDARLRADGWGAVGRKLGFTDRTTWARLGIERPVWGYVYDATVRPAEDGAAFDVTSGVAPRLEVEVVLGLRETPRSARTEDVMRSLAWAALGFEIIDCHYPGWRFIAPDALADLIFHELLFVGKRRELTTARDAELWASEMPAIATLQDRGATVASGGTAAVLGSPITALAELVAMIADEGATPLGAGELVATGTMTGAFALAPGQDLRADVDRLGLEPIRLLVR